MTKRSKPKGRAVRRDPFVTDLRMIDATLEHAEKLAASAAMILQLWPTVTALTPAVAASVTVIKGHIENVRRALLPGMKRQEVQS